MFILYDKIIVTQISQTTFYKFSDVPDQNPDFLKIRIRPDPVPDFFFKLESGWNQIRNFFSN